MKIKLRIISALSAFCFLGSVACFSAFAAEMLQKPSGDDEPTYVEPAEPAEPVAPEPVTPEPVTPEPVTPEPVDPEPVVDPIDSGYEDPGTSYYESGYENPEPGYEDPTTYSEPDTDYSAAYSELISDGNFPQPSVSSTYVDNTQQYNQYIANQNMAQYDDNYIYIPEYEEPTTSLVTTASKTIDTDELTGDDWDSIMLDLSNGNLENDGGTKTFSFIKDNDAEGDTDMMWMVYLGTALIIASVLMIIFVIVTTTKAKAQTEEYYYV